MSTIVSEGMKGLNPVPRMRKAMGVPDEDEPVELLDEKEQEQVISQIKKENDSTNRTFRILLGGAAIVLAFIYFYIATEQYVVPWGLESHFVFANEVDAATVSYVELWSGVGFLFAYRYIHKKDERSGWISLVFGTVPLLFWVWVFFIHQGHFPWHVIWLPFGNLGYLYVLYYADYSIKESETAVIKLKDYMYRFEKP